MQTFLPYANYVQSAKVLDMKRLGKQRVEGYQILCCLLEISSTRWKNHPAVKMWKGYEGALARYVCAICTEWIDRGYKDTVREKIYGIIKEHKLYNVRRPLWIGRVDFHNAHKSNLVRKLPNHYSQHFSIASDLPYVWPVK